MQTYYTLAYFTTEVYVNIENTICNYLGDPE